MLWFLTQKKIVLIVYFRTFVSTCEDDDLDNYDHSPDMTDMASHKGHNVLLQSVVKKSQCIAKICHNASPYLLIKNTTPCCKHPNSPIQNFESKWLQQFSSYQLQKMLLKLSHRRLKEPGPITSIFFKLSEILVSDKSSYFSYSHW